jgi:NADP-dependent 3-hydroxy acid dehydrogenase YdfG
MVEACDAHGCLRDVRTGWTVWHDEDDLSVRPQALEAIAMSWDPSGKVAVVTGASSGIGAATARRRAAAGFHVVAAARRADRLQQLVTGITTSGGSASAVACDITSDEAVAALAAAVPEPLTLLVNNAGGALGVDPIETGSIDDWQWMYDVNVLGTVRVTQALLPALERSGAGTVVVVSSTAG